MTVRTPPAFLVHPAGDSTVALENSLGFSAALRRAVGSAEMRLLPRGGHGFALDGGLGTPSQWFDRLRGWVAMSGWSQESAAFRRSGMVLPSEEDTMRNSLLTLAFSALMALPATASETVDAVRKQQEVEFGYISLGVAYSCELMEARIKMLLRHVGAEKDVDVTVTPCTGFDLPQRRLEISAGFSTLVRAGEGDVDRVKAEWTEVQLGKGHPQSIDDSDCELLEYFQKYLLSTIDHEVLEGTTGCSASRRSILGRLQLKVLKPVAEGVPAD